MNGLSVPHRCEEKMSFAIAEKEEVRAIVLNKWVSEMSGAKISSCNSIVQVSLRLYAICPAFSTLYFLLPAISGIVKGSQRKTLSIEYFDLSVIISPTNLMYSKTMNRVKLMSRLIQISCLKITLWKFRLVVLKALIVGEVFVLWVIKALSEQSSFLNTNVLFLYLTLYAWMNVVFLSRSMWLR